MILIYALIIVLYLSLAAAVLKYYAFRKESLQFAAMSFFASLWGIGSLVILNNLSTSVAYIGFLIFIIPPAISSFFLVEYISLVSKADKGAIRQFFALAFISQLLVAIWFYLESIPNPGIQDISGWRYAIYTIYYIAVFGYSLGRFFSIRRMQYVDKVILLNTASLIFFAIVNTFTNILLPVFGITDLVAVGPASGLVPLIAHIFTIHKHGLLSLSYSFLRFFYSEFFSNSILFTLVSAIALLGYKEPIEWAVLAGLFTAAGYNLLTIVGRFVFDKFTDAVVLDWGGDLRNSINGVAARINGVSTFESLARVIESELRRHKIDFLEVVVAADQNDLRNEESASIAEAADYRLDDSGITYGRIRLDKDPSRLSNDQKVILAILVDTSITKCRVLSLNNIHLEGIKELTERHSAKEANLTSQVANKDESISLASHQLRTPISIASFNNKMMLEGAHGDLTDEQASIIRETQTSVEQMSSIVDELLEAARVEEGTFTVDSSHSIRVRPFAEKVVNKHSLLAREKEISISTSFDLRRKTAHFDELKLGEVLSNFIDNAIKYSSTGSKVKVIVSSTHSHVEVCVKDHGMGVSKDEAQLLFTKFGRSSEAKRKQPDGLGLGLFLAKRTVELHGGEIIFESEEGKGSSFGFRVPA